jgi:hypothetical protein
MGLSVTGVVGLYVDVAQVPESTRRYDSMVSGGSSTSPKPGATTPASETYLRHLPLNTNRSQEEWKEGTFVATGGRQFADSTAAGVCPGKGILAHSQLYDLKGQYSKLEATLALDAGARSTEPLMFVAIFRDGERFISRHTWVVGQEPLGIAAIIPKGTSVLEIHVRMNDGAEASRYGCGEPEARGIWGSAKVAP